MHKELALYLQQLLQQVAVRVACIHLILVALVVLAVVVEPLTLAVLAVLQVHLVKVMVAVYLQELTEITEVAVAVVLEQLELLALQTLAMAALALQFQLQDQVLLMVAAAVVLLNKLHPFRAMAVLAVAVRVHILIMLEQSMLMQ
jgi:hypothetical protein